MDEPFSDCFGFYAYYPNYQQLHGVFNASLTVPHEQYHYSGVEIPSFVCSELKQPVSCLCRAKLALLCNGDTAPPSCSRLLMLFLLDNEFQVIQQRADAVFYVLPPSKIAYNIAMLRFADSLLTYGSFGGFKYFLSQGADIGALEVIPFFVRGLTLGENYCEAMLRDVGVIPALASKAYFQICFARAFYLYNEFLVGKSVAIGAGQSKCMRLCFFGCCLLFYAVAEAFVARHWSTARERAQLVAEQRLHASGLFDEERDIAKAWEVARQFACLLDENATSMKPFGMLEARPLLTPNLSQFPACQDVFRRHAAILKRCFTRLSSQAGLMGIDVFCRLITRSGVYELLPRAFVLELALRNCKDTDKDTFTPALSYASFQGAVFACANYALCREPFVRKLRRPESRLEYFLEKTAWGI